jgi:hypothetical protein
LTLKQERLLTIGIKQARIFADIVEWKNLSLPRRRRGFDSRYPPGVKQCNVGMDKEKRSVLVKKFRELRRKLRVHMGHGLRTGIELHEIESPVVPQ